MLTVSIGSKNPVKINSVKDVFANYKAIIVDIDSPSGVSAQPFSDEETIVGAKNRALHCLKEGKADLGIGLEGGVQEQKEGLFLCNWGAMIDQKGVQCLAGGLRFQLPHEVHHELLQGKELGDIMNDYANRRDVKKKEGAVGIFSNGLITRYDMFSQVVKLLLGQYLHNNPNIVNLQRIE